MPSRSPQVVLLLLAAALALGNLWVTLGRSTIPLALDGRVDEIELRFEKNRGVDDVYLVTVDGDTIHVDASLGPRLDVGDHLRKGAWERTLHVDTRAVPLSPSLDFRRMLVAMPLVGAVVLILLLGIRRARNGGRA